MTSALVGLGREFREIDYIHGEADIERAMTSKHGATSPGSRLCHPPQDVRAWIKNPALIDAIVPNLRALAGLIDSCPEPVSVLDVGCHGGYAFDWLKANCQSRFRYEGCDIAEDIIAEAARLHKDRTKSTWAVADVITLGTEYRLRSFDVVFCARLLIHLPYFRANVARLYTVARRAVLIVLEIGDQDIAKMAVNDGDGTFYHRQFSVDTITETADKLAHSWRIEGKPSGYQSLILEKGRKAKR